MQSQKPLHNNLSFLVLICPFSFWFSNSTFKLVEAKCLDYRIIAHNSYQKKNKLH